MKKIFVCSLMLTVLVFAAAGISAEKYRYYESIFPSSDTIRDVVYGTADFLNSPYYDENDFSTGNLVMDIYEPTGDSFDMRPVIIFAHGGGFVDGNRHHDDMIAFCDSFARKGYVTATIDYRQGVYAVTNAEMHYTRAVYRGIQDGRSAVRYLKANASLYGIDTSRIYFAGSSAGAFIGLHSIYMDKPEEKPAYADSVNYTNAFPPYSYTGPDLGNYDIGDHLTHDGEPDAVMGLWGAVASPALITSDNDESVLLIHGEEDTIVPFDIGSPFGVSTFPNTYGSNQIDLKLDTLGLDNKMTYFVPGEGHEFYGVTNGMWDNGTGGNAYWDTVVDKATEFFWMQHRPTADFTYSIDSLTVTFTDSSEGAAKWEWSFGDSNTDTLQNTQHTYSSPGIYTVSLYIENTIHSWDTVSADIDVSLSGILSDRDESRTWDYRGGILSLKPYEGFDGISVVDITGRRIVATSQKCIDTNDLQPGIYFALAREVKPFRINILR